MNIRAYYVKVISVYLESIRVVAVHIKQSRTLLRSSSKLTAVCETDSLLCVNNHNWQYGDVGGTIF